MGETAYEKTIPFLPPIKQLKNKLTISNKSPIVMENHFSTKNKEFFEVGVDKFNVLTNQPKQLEKIRISGYLSKSKSLEKSFPRATPIQFKWDPNDMPKLKINKASETPREGNISERKKKMMFEAKLAIEQRALEQRLKDARAQEFEEHSKETRRKIKKRKSIQKDTSKPDIWDSCDFRDINLQNDIINHIYSVDNRAIRHYQKQRENFYKFKANKIFDAKHDEVVNEKAKEANPFGSTENLEKSVTVSFTSS